MVEHGYKMTKANHRVFFWKFFEGDFIILLLYVDDMLIVGMDISRINELKKTLTKSFTMKDFGEAQKILGIQIVWDRNEKKLYLSQDRYVEKVLRRFSIDKAKAVSIPLLIILKLVINYVHLPMKRSCVWRLVHTRRPLVVWCMPLLWQDPILLTPWKWWVVIS